ncbi:hypothetical protein GLOIN_2v1783876 [Rhizophagus irregularis DAOM 181602=DAOM 197198]|nr:hypothetical protein GLOIN_2v1783876 [Rhizophagus irregularis DAOM 181602=DAOM 197198]
MLDRLPVEIVERIVAKIPDTDLIAASKVDSVWWQEVRQEAYKRWKNYATTIGHVQALGKPFEKGNIDWISFEDVNDFYKRWIDRLTEDQLYIIEKMLRNGMVVNPQERETIEHALSEHRWGAILGDWTGSGMIGLNRTNPITGRPIIIGGDTFNRIVMESHDYIDGRLVRRQTAPPPEEQPVYLNTDTGRYVQRGTRTYYRLIESDYEVVEDYYLVHNEEEALIEEIINETRYNEENLDGQRLTFNDIQQIRAAIQADQDEYDDFILQQDTTNGTPSSGLSGHPRTLEDHTPRLAELNIELCRKCLMPIAMSTSIVINQCQNCGVITPKTAHRGLSSVLYRQIIKKISDENDPLQALGLARDKLVQIIRRASNVDFTQLFTQRLDMKIMDGEPYEDIRKWLLEQLIAIGCDSGEIALYQFLRDTYPDGIDEPFNTFYENYVNHISNSMTKNFASRALGAIGLKAKMLRIDFEGRKKSAMILRASAVELLDILTRYY